MYSLDILVVDDQPGVRYLLQIIIDDMGHRVMTASNGLEALEVVKVQHPDLIFMDVSMPILNGIEALERIKVISPGSQVVLMTAYISEDTITQAEKKGALKCFAKPFDIEELKIFLHNFEWHRANNIEKIGS